MDQANQSYLAAMAIPSSRRHRFVATKIEQIEKHNASMEAANSRARSRKGR